MRCLATIILTILLLPLAAIAQEHPLEYADYFDSGPVITDFIPDSNFTLMSYALRGWRMSSCANNARKIISSPF